MEIQIADENITYKLIESNRKSIAVEVLDNGEVQVRAPYGMTELEINRLLKSRQRWLYTRVKAVKENKSITENYNTGRRLLFLGRELFLKVEYGSYDRGVFLDGNELKVIVSENHKEQIPAILEKWYRFKARQVLRSITAYYANQMNVRVNQVTIKDQKTRWGSCSSKHNLNYNYRLVMAPEKVIEYVVIHELCHLIQMNHSREFWNEVERVQPEYRQYRKWLKDHQHDLRL